LDGVQNGVDSQPVFQPIVNYPFLIGRGEGYNFNGTLDEIRVWNIARSGDVIRTTMASRLTGAEPGLVAYWPMEEGEGQNTADGTGNNHTGQLGSTPGVDGSDPVWVNPDPPTVGVTCPLDTLVDAGSDFLRHFGIDNTGNTPGTFVYRVQDTKGWVALSGCIGIGPGAHANVAAIINVPGNAYGATDTLYFRCSVHGSAPLRADSCSTTVVVEQDVDPRAMLQVQRYQKITDGIGGLPLNSLNVDYYFGHELAALGDVDGDGVGDVAAGAHRDDDGGLDRGAAWVFFLNRDGTVQRYQKISDTQGGFEATLHDEDMFGIGVAGLGDLDADGVPDMAVGASNDTTGGLCRGAVRVLFLNRDGTVKAYQKINDTEGGFAGPLDDWDYFGDSVASLGDLDGDGAIELAVGAPFDDDAGTDRGAVWVLFLNRNGTVKS